MTWITAHLSAILTVWVVTHVVAQSICAAGAVIPAPVLKAAHVWSAFNPLDVVKAFKAVGSELTVPLPCLFLPFVLLASLSLAGCAKQGVVDPPAVAAAKATQKADTVVAINCAEATGVWDKIQGKGWLALGWDEVKDCWALFGKAFQDAIAVKQAEDAAKAVPVAVAVPDAGAP